MKMMEKPESEHAPGQGHPSHPKKVKKKEKTQPENISSVLQQQLRKLPDGGVALHVKLS